MVYGGARSNAVVRVAKIQMQIGIQIPTKTKKNITREIGIDRDRYVKR